MTKREKVEQDKLFAQHRLDAKMASLKKLENSDLPEHMKQAYRDGIQQERVLIARCTVKLAKMA